MERLNIGAKTRMRFLSSDKKKQIDVLVFAHRREDNLSPFCSFFNHR